MNITPISSSQLPPAAAITNSETVKPLTNEIAEPIEFSISGEGIFVAELAARSDGHRIPQISQASMKVLEFDIKIMQQMKSQRIAGESTGNNIEDLAIAYDALKNSANENSVDSNKHGKFLDDAFGNVARLFFTQEARNQHYSSIDITDEAQNPNINGDAAARLKQAIADAEKNSALFADSFLKNYKKYGLDAFKMAMSSLQSQ